MELERLAKIFKALSSTQRLKLFLNIYDWEFNGGKEGECCSGIDRAFTRACGCMDISRSTISHHLKELQNAGLIDCTRSGQSVSCKINEEVLDLVKGFTD